LSNAAGTVSSADDMSTMFAAISHLVGRPDAPGHVNATTPLARPSGDVTAIRHAAVGEAAGRNGIDTLGP